MALLQIAWAGFQRYRSRRKNFTVIMIGSYFLTCIFMLFFQTVFQNIYRFWVADYVGGDIVVSRNIRFYDYLHPLPPEQYFSFRKFIQDNPTFKDKVSPCLRIGASIESKLTGRAMYCVVNGVDPLNPKGLYLKGLNGKGFIKPLTISEGRMFHKHRAEVVLPKLMADRFAIGLGDSLVIYVMTKDGYLNFDLLKVVGFLNIPLPAQTFYSHTMVYMPLEKLRELVTVDSDQVSEVIASPKAGLFGAALRGNLQRINGLTGFSLVRSLFYAFCFLEAVILFLVFGLDCCAIYHNVGLMNLEREKEMGIYLASGAKPFWIRRLMFFELFIYTVYCSLWGGLLTFLCGAGINYWRLSPDTLPMKLLLACSHFRIDNHIEIYLGAFLIILFLMILGSYRPIWRATGNIRITTLLQKNL